MAFEGFAEILYGALFDALGVSAVFPDVIDGGLTIPVIDKTRGVAVSFGNIDVETLKPAALVRIADLPEGVTAEDLDGEALTLNGVAWSVTSIQARPTLGGPDDGTVYLFLTKAA